MGEPEIEDNICKTYNKELFQQYKLIKDILDAQDNFTLLTDGKYLKLANQTMLDFFGYRTLDDFRLEHNCICEFFLEGEGYLQEEQDGKDWFSIVLEDLNIVHKVKLTDQNGNIHIFYLNTKGIEFDNESHYVVVFTDITKLERLNEEKIVREKQLEDHLKMAQMGSMIGNIAHQWRQPLNNIATIVTGVQVEQELEILSSEQLNKYMNDVSEITQYLSDTIRTFRNFLKEKKEYREIILQDRIDIALKIVNVTLKDNGIELKKLINYDKPIKIKMFVGELEEVIINIINNAKDALKEKGIKKPWVELAVLEKGSQILITIEDNAGGIPNDIKPKIFDEYFSTKDESTGTGLGLYMSKRIIHESLKGKLYVENTLNGAKFFIELPLISLES